MQSRKTRLLLFIVAIAFISSSCFRNGENKSAEDSSKKEQEYTIAAYIWPSCHHDERFGDMLWPERTGEWEIIKKGNPRFEGHYQPKIPLWGYEQDNDPKVMEKWINAATDHGVNTFIFDWYWFDEGPFLESSLNDGFLKADNKDKMDFYLMWANHNVKQNYWNVHKYAGIDTLLWMGGVDFKNFKRVVHRVIDNYFKEPNYKKIDGKPVFSVYSFKLLVEGLGGMEKTAEALEYFRKEVKKAGYPGLHLQTVLAGNTGKKQIKQVENLGFNSVTQYNWGWWPLKEQDYIKWADFAQKRRDKWDGQLSIPLFPNVSIGWDDTPRFPQKTDKDIVRYNKSPESFASYLQETKEYCDNHPGQEKIITIFSWNEWIEGGYLLPDRKYGFGYLEAVKRVIKEDYNPYTTKEQK